MEEYGKNGRGEGNRKLHSKSGWKEGTLKKGKQKSEKTTKNPVRKKI